MVTRERIEAGPHSLWRYADLLPAAPPAGRRQRPGFTPLVPAPRLASALGVGEVLLKLDIANPTHSFKDRVVAVAAAKAVEFGLETLVLHLDRQPRERGRRARRRATGCRRVIFCPAGLEPEKLAATTVYGARDLRASAAATTTARGSISELAGEVDWGFVNVNLRSYYAEGSKTLAFEIVEQLGWETPDAVVAPIASGAMFTKLWQGFEQFAPARAGRRARGRGSYGGQAEGCSPGRDRVRRGAARLAGAPATRSPRRSRSATRPTATSRSRPRAASGGAIYSVPEDEVGENMALLAETAGDLRRDGAPGVTRRRAARRGRRAASVGESDRVVAARHRHRPEDAAGGRATRRARWSRSTPDVDALLEELGVDGMTRGPIR